MAHFRWRSRQSIRCPRSGRVIAGRRPRTGRLLALLAPLVGLASLIWFLVRVAPKPSRAAYPCQRLAAPIASAFVLWVLGVAGAIAALIKTRLLLKRNRMAPAAMVALLGLCCIWLALDSLPDRLADAQVPTAAKHAANQPIGRAVGFRPGRVVWVHDPAATDWDGVSVPAPTGGGWDPGMGMQQGYWGRFDGETYVSNTNATVVAQMLSKSLRWLTDRETDAGAWQAIFTDFNRRNGRGDGGYQQGQRICIKTNLTTTSGDPGRFIAADGTQMNLRGYTSGSIELVLALLTQLTQHAGVAQDDIYIGDTTGTIPNWQYDILQSAGFTGVHHVGKFAVTQRDNQGAAAAGADNDKLYFSGDKLHRHWPVPDSYQQASYLINISVLKTHNLAHITLCAKNYFGSMITTPPHLKIWPDGESEDRDLHFTLPNDLAEGGGSTGEGRYRALVDLMGHPKLGGNAVLNIIDALWTGYDWSAVAPPQKWNMPPFNGDWCSSIFVSQDQVAIDSVGYDFLYAEATVSDLPGEYNRNPRGLGADDYLHEAALAHDPPSGTGYKPDGVNTLASLGVHEHWDDDSTKRYSRNLGAGYGIELISTEPNPPVGRYVFYNNSRFDGNNVAAGQADDAAIATDKTALLPGAKATFANYTSYSRGINGVMVDLTGIPDEAVLTDADFSFRAGNGDPRKTGWSDAPAPRSITIRRGQGAAGSDRVTIIFADGAITGKWIEVVVLPTERTGLISADPFYFGNAIGETGNASANAAVTATDEVLVRNSPHTLAYNPASIEDVCDFDRDGKVGPTDAILCRTNGTSVGAGTALELIEAP